MRARLSSNEISRVEAGLVVAAAAKLMLLLRANAAQKVRATASFNDEMDAILACQLGAAFSVSSPRDLCANYTPLPPAQLASATRVSSGAARVVISQRAVSPRRKEKQRRQRPQPRAAGAQLMRRMFDRRRKGARSRANSRRAAGRPPEIYPSELCAPLVLALGCNRLAATSAKYWLAAAAVAAPICPPAPATDHYAAAELAAATVGTRTEAAANLVARRRFRRADFVSCRPSAGGWPFGRRNMKSI